ncbi:MAG: TIGR02253 family HAD-type hydrolase [Candidatus ainarchaeum sp.]|nr:TIGR02253 family HAD-type hydrolase [Candidatus ainarchaeum sp.]
MIKYILFDIDDTLFPSTEFSTLARKNAINAMISMGLPGDQNAIMAKLTRIIDRKGSNYGGHFDDLCKQLGIKDPARYTAAAVAAYHDTKTAIQPFPKVPLTLLRLKEAGYKLYIATNGDAVKQWDKLIRLRIALYFDGVFVSEELGTEKSVSFYRKVLRRLGARPEECMMVGDREDADIAPARKIGIATVRVLAGKHSRIPTRAHHSLKDISGLIRILQRL